MSAGNRNRTWTYHDDWFPEGYRDHWEPVLAAPALRLLDRVAEAAGAAGGPDASPRVLDIGAGTGLLVIEAARRWPDSTIVAVEPALAMLETVRDRAREAGIDERRLVLEVGSAEDLPVADRSVELAVSSFVFQIVVDRPRALREALRVLRPGGWFGHVTWLAGDRAGGPSAAVDDVLGGPADTDWSGGVPRAGDIASSAAAEAELRDAGFADTRVSPGELRQVWTVERYVAYVEGCRNPAAFIELDSDGRAALRERLRRALSELPEGAFTQRAPLVYALGRRGV